MSIVGEPELDRSDRNRSDWELDGWDEVAEVPAVEPLRRQTRIVKWAVWLSMVLVIVLVLVAGYVGWWYTGKVQPSNGDVRSVPFTVLETDDVDSIAARLEEGGFVEDESVFTWYVEQKGGLEITPGFYQLPLNDHMGNVLARLRTPPDQTYQRITFPEGFTIEQMGQRLEETMPRLSAEAFVEAANDPFAPARYRGPGQRSLEGLLFPDTYQISNADNEAQVVERMISIMERVASQEDLDEQAEALGRTPYEILVIASMIEKEAKLDEDRAKIARVIYNRLFLGMNLQIDAAVRYGAPDPDMPFPQMRQIPGPYNTYLNAGLPVTPIANPGRASIRAALNPAPNPPPGDPICQVLDDPTQGCAYLFYVLASPDGGHAFAVTGEQHQENVNAAAAAGLLD
ncbi:MAG: endolytic transglycosylase MltG [Ilumatobacter sp.]|uniref:endolytic transglycosylase MltG n=1 Tax=Ilumatobacter sp. TaxID=1967498 RepID=UPI00260DFC55|nr:endolytic transglycosylase MltG [Ilumatobacter sp.]MDJ0769902.1 endolytic transglycosylase MltG [Ilumatobacter sp.]